MKNTKKIGNVGQLLMILGSALYLLELLVFKTEAYNTVISVLYILALILMLIGWIGTKEERKAEKARKKAEKAAAKEAKSHA